MNAETKLKRLPIDIIIASFRGELTEFQKTVLDEWISSEENRKKYDALKRVWDNTISNAEEFSTREAYGRFRRRVRNVWKPLAIAASIVAILATGFTFYNIYSNKPSDGSHVYTCVTGKSSLILPDGSSVILRKGSSITYDESFSRNNRTVSLDGEAYFNIAKDPENAFLINVDKVDIVVTGTTFNVLENSQSVTVSLVEGAVQVNTESDMQCVLDPGYSAVYDKGTGTLTNRKDDVLFSSCWALDRLTLTQASLGEVCSYLSKWYNVDIVVSDALKSSCSYTFTIREEPLDQILDIMSRINPMRYMYTNDNRIIISEIL